MTQPPDNRTCAHGCVGLEYCWASARVAAECFTPVSEEPKCIRIVHGYGDPSEEGPCDLPATARVHLLADNKGGHPFETLTESPKDAVKDKREDDCPCDDHEHGTQVGKQCLCCDMNAPVKDEGFDAWHSRFDPFKGEVDAHTFALYRALREEGWLAARRSIPPMGIEGIARAVHAASPYACGDTECNIHYDDNKQPECEFYWDTVNTLRRSLTYEEKS